MAADTSCQWRRAVNVHQNVTANPTVSATNRIAVTRGVAPVRRDDRRMHESAGQGPEEHDLGREPERAEASLCPLRPADAAGCEGAESGQS